MELVKDVYRDLQEDIYIYLARLQKKHVREYPYGIIVHPSVEGLIRIFGNKDLLVTKRGSKKKFMDLVVGIDVSLPVKGWIICQTKKEMDDYYSSMQSLDDMLLHTLSSALLN